MGCELVILACNTASAKALRNIQQNDLPRIAPNKRVLGVIRPSVEEVGGISLTKHVGILGTNGTIRSHSYQLELKKLYPDVITTEEACPMWVPLVENHEYNKPGADYFIQQHIHNILQQDPDIDTLILACTHYPLLLEKIQQFVPKGIQILEQGPLVAQKLSLYLEHHPEMEKRCARSGGVTFFTTEAPDRFKASAQTFLNETIQVAHLEL